MSLLSAEEPIEPQEIVAKKLREAATVYKKKIKSDSLTAFRLSSSKSILENYLLSDLPEVSALLSYKHEDSNPPVSTTCLHDSHFYKNLGALTLEPDIDPSFYCFNKTALDPSAMYIDLFLCEEAAPISSSYWNPLASSYPYGLNKSGIIIGPYMLEFTKYGLVVPSVPRSNIIRFRVAHIPDALSFERIRVKLARLICDYNVNYTYDVVCDEKKSKSNSQGFVEAVLQEINYYCDNMSEDAIKLFVYSLPKMITDYFTAIQKNECVKMTFEVGKDFADVYTVAQYTEFDSYSKFKLFMEHLIQCNPWFAQGYPYEYQLLRSYDISFCLFDPKNVESSIFK